MSDTNSYDFIEDISIRGLIKNLNEAGLKTKYCCSGIGSDHIIENKQGFYSDGYIAFETSYNPADKRNEIIYYIAKSFGLEYDRTYSIRSGKKICLTTVRLKQMKFPLCLNVYQDSSIDAYIVEDKRFDEISKKYDVFAKWKWDMVNKASITIKSKGIINITPSDICNIKFKDNIKSKIMGQFYKGMFKSSVLYEFKRAHLATIIDNDGFRSVKLKLTKSKKSFNNKKFISIRQSNLSRLSSRVINKENEKTLVYRV